MVDKVNSEEWASYAGSEKGIDYQKAAQITWWSILQGLAVVALAEKIPPILAEVNQHNQWYLLLYAVVTLVIIVNAWVQMAWAILIFRWPINLFHTTLILLLGIAAYLSSLYVDTPWYWARAIAFLVTSAIVVYGYNLKNRWYTEFCVKVQKRVCLAAIPN
jgi:hypothetical protein